MKVLWNELDTRLFSPKLWSGFAPPIGGVFQSTASGNPAIGLFDDFVGFGRTTPLASNVSWYQSNGITYKSFEDDDAGIAAAVPTTTPAVDANGIGVVGMTAGNTDNDDCVMQAGGATMMPFNVIQATAKELVFECRVKYSSIADGDTDFFFGLFGTGGAANNGWIGDNPAAVTDCANNDLLGFMRLPATGTSALLFVYDRVGGATASHSSIHTIVADTYFKAGYRFNYDRKTLDVYINGALVHTVTKAETGATPWPLLYMNFLAGIKYQATTQDVMYIDWWACAQAV